MHIIKVVFVDGESLIINSVDNFGALDSENWYARRRGRLILFNKDNVKYMGYKHDLEDE